MMFLQKNCKIDKKNRYFCRKNFTDNKKVLSLHQIYMLKQEY